MSLQRQTLSGVCVGVIQKIQMHFGNGCRLFCWCVVAGWDLTHPWGKWGHAPAEIQNQVCWPCSVSLSLFCLFFFFFCLHVPLSCPSAEVLNLSLQWRSQLMVLVAEFGNILPMVSLLLCTGSSSNQESWVWPLTTMETSVLDLFFWIIMLQLGCIFRVFITTWWQKAFFKSFYLHLHPIPSLPKSNKRWKCDFLLM